MRRNWPRQLDTFGTEPRAPVGVEPRHAAGASFVTQWLNGRFDAANRVEVQDQHYIWPVEPPGRPRFVICVEEAALLESFARIREWLDRIADDATDRPPKPPAYYHISEHGHLAIRGMSDVEFEYCGQRIRCERRPDPTGSKWWVTVDGRECGAAFRARPFDSQQEVARRAVAWLRDRAAVRVPDPPWQWSVLDQGGREWWIRLTTVFDRDHDRSRGRQLVLRDRVRGRELRQAWPESIPAPAGPELRAMVAGLSR